MTEPDRFRRKGRKRRAEAAPSPASLVDPAIAGPVRAAVAAHRGQRGALLPILHAVQAELGHVPAGAVPVLAEELNLSRAEVHGVITFYHDFTAAPAAASVVRVCRAEACQALGAEDLYRDAGAICGGRADLRQVFCLGNCALGPSVELNGRLYGRVDAARLTALLGAS